MKLSIRQVFFNLKLTLILLVIGISFLAIELITITQYSDRLFALKNQHHLINKITHTDLTDSTMAGISLNSDLAELQLYTKLANQNLRLDLFSGAQEEYKVLGDTLATSSNAFQEGVLFWAESMPNSRKVMFTRMQLAKSNYVVDIGKAVDYQIGLINDVVSLAITTTYVIFVISLLAFFFYQWRLKQIYNDIKYAYALDSGAEKEEANTEELDFIIKKLCRRIPSTNNNLTLLNPQSGLNNEKGMIASYNAKRTTKSTGTFFLTHFSIDKYSELESKLSKEEITNTIRKLGEILSMYEQPFDALGHLDNNTFAFLMSRSSKDVALSDAEKITSSVRESVFPISSGILKITLSGGFMLKAPSKTLEESLSDVIKITEKAKESGGNRIAQLRDTASVFR
jgi:GGDEF domain-containing protein